MINDVNRMPFPEMKGISVSPGTYTKIKVAQVRLCAISSARYQILLCHYLHHCLHHWHCFIAIILTPIVTSIAVAVAIVITIF